MMHLITNPFKFRLYLLRYIPAAFASGLRVLSCTEQECIVTVPFKYFTRNPFRSTYFACLSMAAEMSTGILAMMNIYDQKPKVSMLVIAMEAMFHKKAVSTTRFVCMDGAQIREVIKKAITQNEPQTIKVRSAGYNEANELIAEFWITWSFKVRNKI